MRRLRKSLVLLILAGGPQTACGYDALASDGQPQRPLNIEVVQDLQFGRIGGTAGGRVIVDSATGRHRLSAAVHDLGGPAGPATFIVTGEPGRAFKLILPGDRSVHGTGDHRNEALLGRFESTPSAGGVIGPDGRAVITLGATLELGTGQTADTYGASIALEVRYIPDQDIRAAP